MPLAIDFDHHFVHLAPVAFALCAQAAARAEAEHRPRWRVRGACPLGAHAARRHPEIDRVVAEVIVHRLVAIVDHRAALAPEGPVTLIHVAAFLVLSGLDTAGVALALAAAQVVRTAGDSIAPRL